MAKNKFKNALENEDVPYLIAETAYIHEGDFGYLSELVDEALKNKSCDGIKFHIMADIDSYATRDHAVYNLIKKFLFSESQWVQILKKVKASGPDTIILVDDTKAIDFVKRNIRLINAVEIHACALNNIEMLEKIKSIKVPIILGIGGSEFQDIGFAVNYLHRKDILLMHGFQNYPTKYEYINFRRIQKAKEKFKLPVGYADHTSWNDKKNKLITLGGFMSGANILEKHVTLDVGKKRTDFEAAVSMDTLKEIKEGMDALAKTKGDGSFEINDYENVYAKKGPMKFTIVAKRDIEKGAKITKEDLTFRRTGKENNIAQREYLDLIGKQAKEKIPMYSLINWGNVQK